MTFFQHISIEVGLKEEEEVFAHKDMLSRWKDNYKVEGLCEAADVNKGFLARGEKAPYLEATKTIEFRTESSEVFRRVHGDDSLGAWMTRKQDIEGLSAAQIKDKCCIPNMLTRMSEVHVPVGAEIWTGLVAPIPEFGSGKGAVQYELLKRIDKSNYKNTIAIF